MSKLIVPTMAELMAKGEQVDVLFWVGVEVLMTEQKNYKSVCKN